MTAFLAIMGIALTFLSGPYLVIRLGRQLPKLSIARLVLISVIISWSSQVVFQTIVLSPYISKQAREHAQTTPICEDCADLDFGEKCTCPKCATGAYCKRDQERDQMRDGVGANVATLMLGWIPALITSVIAAMFVSHSRKSLGA